MIVQLRSTHKKEGYSPSASQHNIAVSSEAMAYCDVSQGSLMKIECMHEPPSKLHGVIICATKVKVNIAFRLHVSPFMTNYLQETQLSDR